MHKTLSSLVVEMVLPEAQNEIYFFTAAYGNEEIALRMMDCYDILIIQSEMIYPACTGM